jgi:hypothetical protein
VTVRTAIPGGRAARGPDVWLAVAFLGAPITWLATLQAAYSFASFACDAGRSRGPLHAVAALAVAAIVIGMLIARTHLRRGGAISGATNGRRRFLAIGGLVLGAQFLVTILAQDLAVLLLAPCQ